MKKQNTVTWLPTAAPRRRCRSEALRAGADTSWRLPQLCHVRLRPAAQSGSPPVRNLSEPSFLQAEKPTPKEGEPPRVTLLESAVGKTHTDLPKLATLVSSLVNFRNLVCVCRSEDNLMLRSVLSFHLFVSSGFELGLAGLGGSSKCLYPPNTTELAHLGASPV